MAREKDMGNSTGMTVHNTKENGEIINKMDTED